MRRLHGLTPFAVALLLLSRAACVRAQEPAPPAEIPRWDWGFQATTITQFSPSFHSPYEGANSFQNLGSLHPATTFVPTLFLAARLWQGAWVSVQPEFSDGSGVGGAGTGIAAYPNQDVLRVPAIAGRPYVARAFLQQAIPLGPAGDVEAPSVPEGKFLPGGDHMFGTPGQRRLEITFGKISLPDIYDASDFGREAHHGLMSWGLVNTGSWDYAADTRGYTWGLTLAYEGGPVAVRAGTYAMPEVANGPTYDHQLSRAHAENVEVEWDFDRVNDGAIRLLGYLNHARMGSYADSLAIAEATSGTPDITATRQAGRKKYGLGLNGQRRLTEELAVFARVAWDDGHTESFAFTEIDRNASLGLSQTGTRWKRSGDRLIAAVTVNGLSDLHRRYLEAGGFGFQLGDGRLNYRPEVVAEVDYTAHVTTCVEIGLDAQYVVNPGYNRDRGPITVYGIRLHVHR